MHPVSHVHRITRVRHSFLLLNTYYSILRRLEELFITTVDRLDQPLALATPHPRLSSSVLSAAGPYRCLRTWASARLRLICVWPIPNLHRQRRARAGR